jgi:hypothetical protein
MNDGPKKQKKTGIANEQSAYTPQQIYDCAIFELAIYPFDIQSGREIPMSGIENI